MVNIRTLTKKEHEKREIGVLRISDEHPTSTDLPFSLTRTILKSLVGQLERWCLSNFYHIILYCENATWSIVDVSCVSPLRNRLRAPMGSNSQSLGENSFKSSTVFTICSFNVFKMLSTSISVKSCRQNRKVQIAPFQEF